jgi:hypothetical protein
MRNLWIGSINGLHAVVDPAIQVQDSRWVLIYLAIHKRLVPYEKAHGRSVWKDFGGDEDEANRLRAEYRAWYALQSPEQMAAAVEVIKKNDAVTAGRLANAEAKHRKQLEKRSLPYRGIIIPDGWGFIRHAECYDCEQVLGSETHLECRVCRWIVCSNCGACGCMAPARRAALQRPSD